MATVNFYLKPANKKGECSIMLTYFFKGEKLRYSTQLKTKDKYWNVDKQIVKRNGENESEINFALQEFKRILNKIEIDTKFEPSLFTKSYIIERLNEATGKNDKPKVLSFYDVFEEYISDAKGKKTDGLIQIYSTTLKRLKSFSIYAGYNLQFDTIDSKFESLFVNYLMNEHQLLNNTIGKYLKTVKSFMNFALERSYTTNDKFSKFKVTKEEVNLISLSFNELLRIYTLENLSKRLENVRDTFCFACFTGLRFSDLHDLNKSNIKGDYIELKKQKTKDILRIPLSKYAKDIIHKYENALPNTLSNQKMNDYIKEIGELAEINEMIKIVRYTGVKRIEESEPKYKFLTTHTARRTFVTLSLEKGMRPEIVMSITGHKDYKTFKKYIKLTENVKQTEMMNAWK